MYFPLLGGVLCLSLFCYTLLCVRSCFTINLLLLSFRCIVTINVMWLFLMVPWNGLQCVIVIFPDHTHLLSDKDLVSKVCFSAAATATCVKVRKKARIRN